MRYILLSLAITLVVVGSTSAQASVLYNINLAGDSTATGTLDWAGNLSSDGAFSRVALTDINALSITVGGVTFTAADEDGPFPHADYEVAGGELVKFDATLAKGEDSLFFGVQTTNDGGLSSNDWVYQGEETLPPTDPLSGTYTLTRPVGQDTDGDGQDDVFDNAPNLYNPFQIDSDEDGIGDVADDDIDGDGIKNDNDNAALSANAYQSDFDGDAWGDAFDPDPDDPAIPGNTFVAELNGPYQYNPNIDSFVFLSAAGSDDPIGSYFLNLSLDLDDDGQYDDLTQFGPSSLTLSLNMSQLQSFGLDQSGPHTIGLRVSGLQGSSTDSASLNVVTTLPGDFNLDGDVDGDDFLMWQRDPSIGSLADWEANYGKVAGPVVVRPSAVPEPLTWTLLVLFSLAMMCHYRMVRTEHGR